MRKAPQNLSRLYFRFIEPTPLSAMKVTVEQVAEELEKWGLIRIEGDQFYYKTKFDTEDVLARLLDVFKSK